MLQVRWSVDPVEDNQEVPVLAMATATTWVRVVVQGPTIIILLRQFCDAHNI